MTPNHLLPTNATPLEQALSLSTDALTRLAQPTDAIRQFKTDPSDPLLPWLIWEYGLGELLPYLLANLASAIAEGILWQRLRGTPRALQIALGWMGADDVFVEPEVPGVHFAEFQIDPGQVLDDDRLIADPDCDCQIVRAGPKPAFAVFITAGTCAASCRRKPPGGCAAVRSQRGVLARRADQTLLLAGCANLRIHPRPSMSCRPSPPIASRWPA